MFALWAIPYHLDHLEFLHTLLIADCGMMYQLPPGLAKATQLQSLQLNGMPCLTDNSDIIHDIGGLTNLKKISFGPWEGTNFPVSFQRLVNMRQLKLQVRSDAMQELYDPTVLTKIAWILSGMPKLEEVRIAH